jgi:predicted lipoprotein
MKKLIKYIIYLLILLILGYNSVYFKKLSDINNLSTKKFNASLFSTILWEEKMPHKMDSSVDFSQLKEAVSTNEADALKKYTNAMGIGNYRYALVKTKATVLSVYEDEVTIQLPGSDTATIATEYIYGNAIRDASSLVAILDFPNTSELNSISEELNKIVRTSVLSSFKKMVKKGQSLNIIAAVELNKAHIKWNGLELLPVRIQIVN